MALYESVLIARQDISAAQAEHLGEVFAQIVKDNGGAVTKTEYWGLKTLAYKIKKNRKGHYLMFNINAPSAAVLEAERNMGLNEDVLRYMTVRVDALDDTNPSVMMQSRNERGDRGDRGERPGRRFDDRGPRPPRRHDNAGAVATPSEETQA